MPDAATREPLRAPSLAEIEKARERIEGIAIRTPCVRLHVEAPNDVEVWLKLENLQPIGSFKLRGAVNAMRALPPERLARGVYTASAGNMAQGLAWGARLLGVPCSVVVPDHAPRAKLDAIERLGGRAERVPFDAWWQAIVEHGARGMTGEFIHPVANADVIAGNGTIGLEIFEELGSVDAVIVPYGGGGLSCGIAAALRAVSPQTAVWACEVETATPFATSLDAGEPTPASYRPSFVDGIGGKTVLPEMWQMARELLRGSLVVSVEAIASAVRTLLTRAHVVAEGAGAASTAAALGDSRLRGRVVCVVSGGNIDVETLAAILRNQLP
jgi:threonine dehydratase